MGRRVNSNRVQLLHLDGCLWVLWKKKNDSISDGFTFRGICYTCTLVNLLPWGTPHSSRFSFVVLTFPLIYLSSSQDERFGISSTNGWRKLHKLTVLGSAGVPPYHADNAFHTASGSNSKSLPRHNIRSRFNRPPSFVSVITCGMSQHSYLCLFYGGSESCHTIGLISVQASCHINKLYYFK